ncbi:MAG: type II secretion system protein [Phycisphaerales bacterium]|nr:type II secretion system protein [Phycisphaerales bacterium]
MKNRAFTLIELLVVVAIMALLIGILMPMLGKSRQTAKTTICMANLRTLSAGWDSYADQNKDVIPGGRMPNLAGGAGNPKNWYEVGTGLKFRPTWIATIGSHVGVYPFNEPLPATDPLCGRQDYDSKVFQCPERPDWKDERNHCYGYNYLFLGNSRMTAGKYNNYPRKRGFILQPSMTVMGADALGTAGSFNASERTTYTNNGTDDLAPGNEGFNLDAPRLTPESDRCSAPDRSGPDPRHLGRTNFLFTDEHVETKDVTAMGYAITGEGKYIDQDGPKELMTNKYFSGTAIDDDPPPLPK